MTQKVWFTHIGHAQHLHTFDERQAASWRDRGSVVDEYVKVEPVSDEAVISGETRKVYDGTSSKLLAEIDHLIHQLEELVPAPLKPKVLLAHQAIHVLSERLVNNEIQCFKVELAAVGDRGSSPAPQPSRAASAEDVERVAKALKQELLFGPYNNETVVWLEGEFDLNVAARAALAAAPDRRREHLLEAAEIAETRCEYCIGYTGLPGGACSDCMNTGFKWRDGAEIAFAIRAAADVALSDTGQEGAQ